MSGRGRFKTETFGDVGAQYDWWPASEEKDATGSHAETNIGGSVFLLCATILGAGILAIPHNFDLLGMGVGLGCLMIFAILNFYSIWMMLKAAEAAGETTYERMVEAAFPRFGRAIVTVFVLILIFGALSAFLVIIAGILTGPNGIVPYITNKIVWYTDRSVLLFAFTVIFIFPLSMLPNISKLEYSSFVAVVIIIYFTGVVMYLGITAIREGTAHFDKINWVPTTFDGFFNALPVFALAYTCQINVFPIRAELHEPTARRMNIVNASSMTLSTVLYMLVGFFGYLVYPTASGNVLESLPDGTFYLVLRILFVLAILFHYPVVHFAFRQTLEEVIFENYEKPNWIRHTIETIIVISATLVWAIQFKNLQYVFSLTGTLAAFPICYIIPAFCYIRLVHFKFAEEPAQCSCANMLRKWKAIFFPTLVIVLGLGCMGVGLYTCITNEIP